MRGRARKSENRKSEGRKSGGGRGLGRGAWRNWCRRLQVLFAVGRRVRFRQMEDIFDAVEREFAQGVSDAGRVWEDWCFCVPGAGGYKFLERCCV